MVIGRFRFDRVVQFGAEVRDTRAGPTMGFYQIVLLERDGASSILVNRGWVPQRWEMQLDHSSERATVIRYVQPSDIHHWFSSADNKATRQFYTLDPQKIGDALAINNLAPFIAVALGQAKTEFYPVPAQHLPQPPNNNLHYVIIWYSLSVALVIIFVVWAWSMLSS